MESLRRHEQPPRRLPLNHPSTHNLRSTNADPEKVQDCYFFRNSFDVSELSLHS
jgi:hypothetical protein